MRGTEGTHRRVQLPGSVGFTGNLICMARGRSLALASPKTPFSLGRRPRCVNRVMAHLRVAIISQV